MKIILEIKEIASGGIAIWLKTDGNKEATPAERDFAEGIKELLKAGIPALAKALGSSLVDHGEGKPPNG